MPELNVALAGNPNAGKSTIFNALTGLRQHTGNWPGKTVAKRSGRCSVGDVEINVVDLPGTYSLAAYSPDEIVARDYIIDEHPDAIICVVDASNLERNLYLVVQVLELGVPVIVALNMADQAAGLGIRIDYDKLSRLLGGSPVVPTVASRGKGIAHLLAVTVRKATQSGLNCHCTQPSSFFVDYGQEVEEAIESVSGALASGGMPLNGCCPRWMSVKLLEGEADMVNRLRAAAGGTGLLAIVDDQVARLEALCGDDVDIIAAGKRYGLVSDVSRQVMSQTTLNKVPLTERIDSLVTHRLFGLPIFMLVMYLVFRLVIDVADPFLNWVDQVINGPVARGLAHLLAGLNAAEWLRSLLIEGVLAGVGGVLVFVPGLAVLYFFLALLEDSGYLARAAFVMDRFMQLIGLHGKSVIPLMLGFGCAVPAVYATRTIANRRDRLLTALLIPFMSCSARLPVYLVFAMAFFGEHASNAVWLLYAMGVIAAVLIGLLLSRTFLRPDDKATFLLELPTYRLPTAKGLLIHTWENTRAFVAKAGTVILAISALLWFLLNLPWGVADQRHSYFGRLSAFVAPALEPAGFGEWESAGSLVTGFVAKELVVSTLSQIYTGAAEEAEVDQPMDFAAEFRDVGSGFVEATLEAGGTLASILPGVDLAGDQEVVEDTKLSAALGARYSPIAAFAFLTFVLLYTPCVATVSAIRQEFGWRWAATSAFYQTIVAWAAAVAVYQVGRFIGVG